MRLGIDVSFLENAEKELGPIIATDRIKDMTIETIKRMHKLAPEDRIVWRTRLEGDNGKYGAILEDSAPDLGETLRSIAVISDRILAVLHKLDPGASVDDADLIANARWIRSKTDRETIVVSDDRDLLTCGHVISSFFGTLLGFLSTFEFLRLSGLTELLSQYCEYYSLQTGTGPIEQVWSKEDLEASITSAMRKARLACHPNLRSHDPLSRITRA